MSGKRGKGEGSVHRLPSGSWQSQIMDGFTDEGKRRIVSFTASTRAEALHKMREYLMNKQEEAEREEEPEIPLFAEYAQRWYEAYRSQVEESTYANYRYTLKLLDKAFGELRLDCVKTAEVNRFINNLSANGYSSSQISKCRSMLIQILDTAEADDLVIKNYARRAFRSTKRLSKSQKTHQKDAFTIEETETLLRDLPQDILGHSIRLMLISGLRTACTDAVRHCGRRELGSGQQGGQNGRRDSQAGRSQKLRQPPGRSHCTQVSAHSSLAARECGTGFSLVRTASGKPSVQYRNRPAQILSFAGTVSLRAPFVAALLPPYLCDAFAAAGSTYGNDCPADRAHQHQNDRELSSHFR